MTNLATTYNYPAFGFASGPETNQNFYDIQGYINARNSGTASWDALWVANSPVFKGPSPWIDVKWFGALGDGSTDDIVAITAALAFAPATGAVVYFPAGTYIVSTPIFVKSNITLLGDGQGRSTLKLKNNVMPGAGADGGRVITNLNWSVIGSTDKNIEVRDLTVDGNAANNPDIALGSAAGCSFGYATNVRLYNIEIKNVDGYAAIYFGDTISGSETTNPGIRVVRCVIRDSVASTAGGSYGQAMFITAPQTVSCYVMENYCINNRQGIVIEDRVKNSLIMGNVVIKSSASSVGNGIWSNCGVDGAGNRIIGNFIKNYGNGIAVDTNGRDHVVMGNIVDNCNSVGINFSTGGSATDAFANGVISGNIVKNTQAGPGIKVGSAFTDILIDGNRCYDDQTPKTQTYGIQLDGTTSNITVCNNDLRGNLTAAASIAGTNQWVFRNMGYNTALTSGRVPYVTSDTGLTDSSGLTFDGTTLTATQMSSGASTFTGAVTITPTTNQLVLGTTRTVTLTAPTPATSSRTHTIPDITGNGTFTFLEGTQTFTGTKTFSATVTFAAITATNVTDSALTSGRVTFASTGGLLADSGRFTFDGTALTVFDGSANVGFKADGTTAVSVWQTLQSDNEFHIKTTTTVDILLQPNASTVLAVVNGGNVGVNTAAQFGSGTGVIGIANAGANPSTNPTGGGVLYCSAGALLYRGSAGTVTPIAPA